MGTSYYYTTVTDTDIAAGNNYVYIDFKDLNTVGIQTGTLTAMDVTLEATLKNPWTTTDADWIDVTNSLFSVATLASDTLYENSNNLTYNALRVKYVQTSGTNAVDFDLMAKKTTV